MEVVSISTEMVTLVGAGSIDPAALPVDAVALVFSASSVSIYSLAVESPDVIEGFVLAVARDALARLFGWDATALDGQSYHLSHELRGVADALLSCEREGEALRAYRMAKSIELLCDAVHAIDTATLVPEIDAPLTAVDTRRILEARKMIDERWNERLTLAAIARACGLNRAKLTRGFRALYSTSVAEALLERRLGEARRALLTTDLPVGQVAYRNGYLNNASFARAFGRRYGQSPSDCRARVMAA